MKIRKSKKSKLYFFIILFIAVFIIFIYLFEKHIVPAIISIGEKYVVNLVNEKLNESISETIEEMQISSSDFFNKSFDGDDINYIDVNTLAINNFCLNISNNLSELLKKDSIMQIELPLGMIFGFNALSNIPPKIKLNILYSGENTIDYETSFKSVGINQINFQIYINAVIKVAIVNPMYKKDIEVTRKLMIINTVFKGDVPNTYFNYSN